MRRRPQKPRPIRRARRRDHDLLDRLSANTDPGLARLLAPDVSYSAEHTAILTVYNALIVDLAVHPHGAPIM